MTGRNSLTRAFGLVLTTVFCCLLQRNMSLESRQLAEVSVCATWRQRVDSGACRHLLGSEDSPLSRLLRHCESPLSRHAWSLTSEGPRQEHVCGQPEQRPPDRCPFGPRPPRSAATVRQARSATRAARGVPSQPRLGARATDAVMHSSDTLHLLHQPLCSSPKQPGAHAANQRSNLMRTSDLSHLRHLFLSPIQKMGSPFSRRCWA